MVHFFPESLFEVLCVPFPNLARNSMPQLSKAFVGFAPDKKNLLMQTEIFHKGRRVLCRKSLCGSVLIVSRKLIKACGYLRETAPLLSLTGFGLTCSPVQIQTCNSTAMTHYIKNLRKQSCCTLDQHHQPIVFKKKSRQTHSCPCRLPPMHFQFET